MFSTIASILFVLSTPQPLFTASAPSNPGEAAHSIVAYVAAREAADIVGYVTAVDAWEAAQRPVETPPGPTVTAPQTLNTAWPSSLYPCGGDLPPCYVKARESGGDYNAQNPTSSASGAWQFLDSTWAGYGGYARAVYAPPAVQDAKARELWAGGAGCSHWAAC